ncbi:MAG: zinc ribbon domain-containing protein [Firmicutes bacterium]|nr:zinc ribbon domain-containing protein [Bacillota bacterium]
MELIIKNWKIVARIVMVLALLCFFLPFVTVSCQDQNVKTLSGMELVMGAKFKNILTGQVQTNQPALHAVFMFIIVIAGILSLFLLKKEAVLSKLVTLIGVGGVFLNLSLQSYLSSQAEKNGLKVQYKSGITLLLIMFILSAVLGFIRSLSPKKAIETEAAKKTCKQCGANNPSNTVFCSQCGAILNLVEESSDGANLIDLRD